MQRGSQIEDQPSVGRPAKNRYNPDSEYLQSIARSGGDPMRSMLSEGSSPPFARARDLNAQSPGESDVPQTADYFPQQRRNTAGSPA